MNGFLQLLWKEWREQRVALALTFGFLVLALGLWIGFLIPSNALWDPGTMVLLMGIPAGAFLLVGGADLSGGTSPSAYRFVERLPGGPSAAFRARMVHFVLTLAAFAVLGWILVTGIVHFRFDGAPRFRGNDVRGALSLFFCLATVGLWCAATASWVPKATLALPVALVTIVVTQWPLVAGYVDVPWLRLSLGETAFCLACSALGAVPAAWASFVLGRRRDGSLVHAAKVGGLWAVCLATPSWALGAFVAARAHAIDPASEGFAIDRIELASERYAFVNVTQTWRKPWQHPLVIDLQTGEWHKLGPVGSRASSSLDPESFQPRIVIASDSEVLSIVGPDSRTPRDFPSELIYHGARAQGQGYVITKRGQKSWYDPYRERTYEETPHFPPLGRNFFVITRTGWLYPPRRDDPTWKLFDPDRGDVRELAWEVRGSAPLALPSGQVLISDEGRAFLGTPGESQLTPVTSDTPYTGQLSTRIHFWWKSPLGPDDPVLLEDGERRVFRLDPESATLTLVSTLRAGTAVPTYAPIHGRSGHVLTTNGKSLSLVDLDSGSVEIVFP